MSVVGPSADQPVHHVDPLPVEARAFQGQHAGIVTRTAACVVDFGVTVAVLLSGYATWTVITFLVKPSHFSLPTPSFLFLLVCGDLFLIGYFTVAWATSGRSYGAYLLGLRVVNFRGERVRWVTSLVRSVFCVLFPIGLFWAVVSPSQRSVQDTVLRTSVRYDWTSRRPAAARL